MSDAPSASDPLAALSSGRAFVKAEVGPCTCLPAYKDRGLADPQCAWCDHGEALAAYVRDRERERDTFKRVAAFTRKAWDDFADELRRITGYAGPNDGDQLLAHVRDLEGARERVEGLLKAEADQKWKEYHRARDLAARLRDLEAALHRLAGHHHAVSHQGRYETCSTSICREAREALSPPGPTQVAPAAPDTGGGE